MAIQGYQQALERTIVVGTAGVAASRGVWPAKAPSDELDYWLDFSTVILVNPTSIDPIVSVIQVTTESGLSSDSGPTISAQGTDGTLAMVVIAGGTDGDNPTISIQVGFASGRTMTFSAVLPMRSPGAVTPVNPQQGLPDPLAEIRQELEEDPQFIASVSNSVLPELVQNFPNLLQSTSLTQPVTGGFGSGAIDGLPNASSQQSVAQAIRSGAWRALESFSNSGIYSAPYGSSLPSVNTNGVWLAQEHYLADRDAGLAIGVTSPVINPTAILQAAIHWCATQNLFSAVRYLTVKTFVLATQHGTYEGVGQLVLPDVGDIYLASAVPGRTMVHLVTRTDYKSLNSGDGIIVNETQQSRTVRLKNFYISGFGFHRPIKDAVNWYSNSFTTDYRDFETCYAGDTAGINMLFDLPMSSNAAACAEMSTKPVTDSGICYFDQTGTNGSGLPVISGRLISGTPGNRTYTTTTFTLAQLQAYLATAPASGLGLLNINYIFQGCTAVSISYLTGSSTVPGFSGFAVQMAVPVNPDGVYGTQSQSAFFANQTYPAKAAQMPTPADAYTPELRAKPAMAVGNVIFTTGYYNGSAGANVWNNAPINYPYFARGTCINLIADRVMLQNIESSGWSQGQTIFNGGGDYIHDRDCSSYCNDMRDTGIMRWHLGANRNQIGLCISENLYGSTGDQCIQPQAASLTYNNGSFKPWSNQSVFVNVSNAYCFCPNAAPFAIAAPIPNTVQGIFINGNAVTAPTTLATFASGSASQFSPLGTVYSGAPGTSSSLTLPALAYAALVGQSFVASGYANTINTVSSNNNLNNYLQYVGNNASGVYPGSFVRGYSDAGGSAGSLATGGAGLTGVPNGTGAITIDIAAPQNFAGLPTIRHNVAAPRWSFQAGVPVGGLTLSIRINLSCSKLLTGAPTQCVTVTNQDDSINVQVTAWGNTFDCWRQRADGAAGISLFGANFGGASYRSLGGNTVEDPFSCAFQTSGNCPGVYLDATDVFGQAQGGRVSGFAYTPIPNVYLTTPGGQIGGEVQGNIGAPNIQVGDKDGSVALGVLQPNNADDSVLDGLYLSYVQNGQPCGITANAQRVHVKGVRVAQAAPPASGFTGAGFSFIGVSGSYPIASNGWNFSACNWFGYDGTPVTLGIGTSAFQSGGALVAGVSGFPSLPMSAAFAQIITGAPVTNYGTGNWYPCEPFASGAATSGSSTSVAQGVITGLPFKVRHKAVVTGIAFRCTTASDSAGIARLGIYAVSASGSPSPTTLIFDAGEAPTTSAGATVISISSGPTLTAGDYVVAYQCSAAGASTAATLTCAPVGGKLNDIMGGRTAANALGVTATGGWTTATSNTGTLPATFPTPTTLSVVGAPAIALQLTQQ